MWLEKGNLQLGHFLWFADLQQNFRLKSTWCQILRAVSLWIVNLLCRLYFKVLCTSHKNSPQSPIRYERSLRSIWSLGLQPTVGGCFSSIGYFLNISHCFQGKCMLEVGKRKCCSGLTNYVDVHINRTLSISISLTLFFALFFYEKYDNTYTWW